MNEKIEIAKEIGYLLVLFSSMTHFVKNYRHQLNAKKVRAIFDRLMAVETFMHGLIK